MEPKYEQNYNRTPEYNLTPEEVDRLSRDIIYNRASHVPESVRYITVEIDGSDNEYANIGRYVERAVFEEAFGNDNQVMANEYGPYESASVFFVSFDRESMRPTGALRVIGNSPSGLKTLNDAQHEPFNVSIDESVRFHDIANLDEVWDVGTVAVLPEYRTGQSMASIQLYRTMYLSALKNNIKHLVSIVDDELLGTLVNRLAIPFVSLADSPSGHYLGSEKSHAVYAYVPDFYEKMSQALAPETGMIAKIIMSRLVNGSADDSIVLL